MRLLIRCLCRRGGFTLIELLTVMAIIAILAGLILSISGYATKKGALSRASGEIQALSAACEAYKADNGSYPHQPLAISGTVPLVTASNIPSDLLDPRTMGNSASGSSPASNPPSYTAASLELYEALTGDLTCTGTGGGPGVKNYLVGMKSDVWGTNNPGVAVSSTNTVFFLSDPFGNSYGYSTANATTVATGTSTVQGYTYPTSIPPAPGYNSSFDLWSTGGQTTTPNAPNTSGSSGDVMLQWVRNW